MGWTNVGYMLFQAGALLAIGIAIYGAWLHTAVPETNSHNATVDGESSGAAPEAKQFPALLQY